MDEEVRHPDARPAGRAGCGMTLDILGLLLIVAIVIAAAAIVWSVWQGVSS